MSTLGCRLSVRLQRRLREREDVKRRERQTKFAVEQSARSERLLLEEGGCVSAAGGRRAVMCVSAARGGRVRGCWWWRGLGACPLLEGGRCVAAFGGRGIGAKGGSYIVPRKHVSTHGS